MAVNAARPAADSRVRLRYKSAYGRGRIVALTSDHTPATLPMVRARERSSHRRRVSPGTGPPRRHRQRRRSWPDRHGLDGRSTSGGRRRHPVGSSRSTHNAARLVMFLCSPKCGWINCELIHSDGGIQRVAFGNFASVIRLMRCRCVKPAERNRCRLSPRPASRVSCRDRLGHVRLAARPPRRSTARVAGAARRDRRQCLARLPSRPRVPGRSATTRSRR